MFHENQKIGLYTLIRKIGQGGFGEVWLAENLDNSPSEKVAIKLPRKDQIDLQAVKTKFSTGLFRADIKTFYQLSNAKLSAIKSPSSANLRPTVLCRI